MPGVAGKKARLKFSATSGGAGVVVLGVKSISHSIDGATVDDSEMGVEWMQSIAGLLGGKITVSGNRRLTDATGQNAILSAMLAGTEIWIHVLPDNSATAGVGFKQQCICTKFGTDAAVEGGNGLSMEFTATGAVTLI